MWSLKSLVLTILASALFRTCTADVGFKSPAAGDTITGSTIDVEFEEGSGTPPLADFATYQLQLCAGGNTPDTFVRYLLPSIAYSLGFQELLLMCEPRCRTLANV